MITNQSQEKVAYMLRKEIAETLRTMLIDSLETKRSECFLYCSIEYLMEKLEKTE